MRACRNFTLFCFCLFGLGTAFSQIFPARPPVDLFVGYSYVNADTNGASRQNLNGWSTSSSVNFRRWLALEGEVSGHYGGANASDYTFAAGPRFHFRPIFVHALFGDSHQSSGGSAPTDLSTGDFYPALTANMVEGEEPAPPPPAPSATVTSSSQDNFVMIFGGGVQWRVAPSWSVRASVDYVGTNGSNWQDNMRVGGGIVYTVRSGRRWW